MTDLVKATYEVPTEADMVLILEPTEQISDIEWQILDDWIDDGGTLLLVGEQFPAVAAYQHFDVTLQVLFFEGTPTIDTPLTVQPIISELPVEERVRFLNTARTDMVPLLSINGPSRHPHLPRRRRAGYFKQFGLALYQLGLT